MIDILFQFGSEYVLVKISGNQVLFGNTSYGAYMAPLEGLKLSHEGVIKQFPDLKDVENWQQEALARFKEKIRELKTERAAAEYVIEDLRKHGYIPKFLQQAGYRREVIA